MFKNCFILITFSLAFIVPGHADDKTQSLEAIYAFVKATAEQQLSNAAEYQINVLPLDEQLRLPECHQPLESFKVGDLVKAGRVSIGVRCNAEKKWSIYVSAVILVYEHVIVLTRAVQRGDLITAQDLALEKHDVSKYRGDYMTQAEQVQNKQAARNLSAGSVLSSRSLIEPSMVKRKDKVTISNAQSGFSIQMSGIAMMDGVKGQLIRVKNESSGRIIGAKVVDSGLVVVQ